MKANKKLINLVWLTAPCFLMGNAFATVIVSPSGTSYPLTQPFTSQVLNNSSNEHSSIDNTVDQSNSIPGVVEPKMASISSSKTDKSEQESTKVYILKPDKASEFGGSEHQNTELQQYLGVNY